jgi:hypothetical protein
MFAVTFPDNGCANFFLTSNSVADALANSDIAQSFRQKENRMVRSACGGSSSTPAFFFNLG